MGYRDNLLRSLRLQRIPQGDRRPPRLAKRARLTQREEDDFAVFGFIAPPTAPNELWRTEDLDSKTYNSLSASRLIELLADLSPELSAALFYHVLFLNPGVEITTTRPGEEDEPDEAAQAALEAFLSRLDGYYGSRGVVFDRLMLGAVLRGAFLVELVLNDNREPVDLVVPDPHIIRFRQDIDDERGPVWQIGQWDKQFVPLDVPTIQYVPVHPLPGGPPYGRSPLQPAIHSALFLLSLLRDLKRVVQQQGYPRLDIAVKLEQLATTLMQVAPEVAQDADKFREWVEAAIDEVEDTYGALEPDDAFVHADTIEVNQPVGTLNASSLGAVDSIIRAVERSLVRALKTMPLLLGINEATTETHANRQWEIYVAMIRSLQHNAETVLERLLGLALQLQGIQADVSVSFAEIRASERLRDAQAEALEIANARQKYEAGWWSQDEAALEVVGHEADEAVPRQTAGGFGNLLGDMAGNDGQEASRGERWGFLEELRFARETVAGIRADAERVPVGVNGHE